MRLPRATLGLALFLVGSLLLSACATSPKYAPAPITHIVLVKLKNPADAEALIRDAESRLAVIPSIKSYAAGKPLNTGRASVIADYDVGFYMGFATEADYKAYEDHPNHKAMVADWTPRLEWLKIRDFLDETP